ncbi:hypothetical protein EDD15DRAFT_2200400 [Pisolithus albus]|nr:hypothetical protein EDD15DRAFT_2200400 [Pisolithus albus]
MSAPKRNIVRANADYFLIRVVPEDGPDGKYVAVHREQVASFFSYDKAIRRREKRYPEVPIGYHQFREAFSREAKTNARFAYRELNGQGGTHVVEPGPPPSKDEVLGGSADLRSPEEKDGGQLMTKRQVSTVNGMLWELAEQTQRKKEWSHQRYLDRRTRREDRRHDRDPTTDRRSHSPGGGPYPKGNRASRSDRRREKSRATDAVPDTPSTVYAPLEASSTTDVASAQEVTVNVPPAQTETAAPINNQPGPSSQTLGSYFTEVEFYTNMLPGPSSVGTSATALDEASFSETVEMAGEGETYEFTEDGVDESMEPGNSAEGAV